MGAHVTLLADCRASGMPAPRHGSQPRAAPTRIPDDHLASRHLQPRNSSVAGLSNARAVGFQYRSDRPGTVLPAPTKQKRTIMRASRSFAAAVVWALGIVGISCSPSQAQPAPTTGPALGKPCNPLRDVTTVGFVDPFLTQDLNVPVDDEIKKRLLNSGLPCQDAVNASADKTLSALDNRQRGFDFYSWLTFIALNSPADGTSIENAKPGSKLKTHWQHGTFFKPLLEVMLEPKDQPPIWSKKIVPDACQPQYNSLTQKEKDNIILITMIEESWNEPFKTGALIDQQGNYAIFDILMNDKMFGYIEKHKLYSKAVQMSPETAELRTDFPAGQNPDPTKNSIGDPGAIMVKVSWRVLDIESDHKRFHTADALIQMPKHGDAKPPCLRKTLGLVGFHVGHKTETRLQWIWTSFEHVENVPEQRDVRANKIKRDAKYSFYDPACKTCPENQAPPPPWDPVAEKGLKFHSPFKSQITRVVPLTDATKDMNKRFQKVLAGTVWENYMLLSTQWPSGFPCAIQKDSVEVRDPPKTDFAKQPDMNCAPAPTYLANSTLETYSQGKVPLASSNCMDCHGNAVSYQRRPANAAPDFKFYNQSDFTFMLEKAQ